MMVHQIKLARLAQFFAVMLFTLFFSHLAVASAGKVQTPESSLPQPSLLTQNKKVPVIIDTDMGIDDWFALLYLLNRTDVAILAITIPVTGASHCQAGMTNINKLIDLSGKMKNKHIPVACGKAYTDKFMVPFPEKWRTEADLLAGISLPPTSRRSLAVPAELVIQEVVEKQAKLGVKPIIITLGPLTTLANILERNPHFKNKVAQVVSMGGAVSVKGNVHYVDPIYYQNRVSERNFYADPLAAKKVIESGIAFKLVALDATDKVPLNQDFLNNLKLSKKTKSAEFVYLAISNRIKRQNHVSYCFWDCLTIAMAFDEHMGSFKSLPISINYGDPKISGQTAVDHQNGQYIQVALDADPKRFHQDFLEVINR